LLLSRDLSPATTIKGAQTFDFIFKKGEKPYESYDGMEVWINYFLKVSIG